MTLYVGEAPPITVHTGAEARERSDYLQWSKTRLSPLSLDFIWAPNVPTMVTNGSVVLTLPETPINEPITFVAGSSNVPTEIGLDSFEQEFLDGLTMAQLDLYTQGGTAGGKATDTHYFVTYIWDFGDGTKIETGSTEIEHTFINANFGQIVKLTGIDNFNNRISVGHCIYLGSNVVPPPPPITHHDVDGGIVLFQGSVEESHVVSSVMGLVNFEGTVTDFYDQAALSPGLINFGGSVTETFGDTPMGTLYL